MFGLLARQCIACTAFPSNLGAMTVLHPWIGMDDDRYSADEICSLIQNSPKYSETLKRIKNTDLLLVDEISTLSVKMFEQLERICAIKDSKLLFWGNAGDFQMCSIVMSLT